MHLTKFYLPLVILSFSAGFAARDLSKPSAPAILTRMDSCLNTFNPDEAVATDAGWIHWFTKKELSGGLNLKMTRVDKQQAYHPAHKHNDPEIILVLEGEARLTLEDEERIVPQNTSLFCPPGLMHGISRASDKPLRYLIIRTQ
ncbi:MAG TPA: cupin domain-containing protein [Cyclobacteriaceae bacterium]